MSKLSVIFLLFLFTACKKEDLIIKTNSSDSPIISLRYENNGGENLLQVMSSKRINNSDIDVLE